MANKEEERAYLKEFLILSGLYDNDKSIKDFEEPDFIVTLSNKQVAVEVTNFYQGKISRRGSKRKEREEIWKKIRKKLQKGSLENKISNANVVCFAVERNNHAPRREEIKEFTDQLIQYVSGRLLNLHPGNKDKITRPELIKSYPMVGAYIRDINILSLPNDNPINWRLSPLTRGSIGNMSDEIDAIIQNKMNKVFKYRENIRALGPKIKKLCLLIIASGDTPSSSGDFRKDNILKMAGEKEAIFRESGFDQIWFLSDIPKFSLFMFPLS